MRKFHKVSWMVLCFFTIASVTGQQTLSSSNSINDQFNSILEKSESYKDLKIVKREWIQNLKQEVLSSVSNIESELHTSKSTLKEQSAQIDDLKSKLNKTNEVLLTYTNSGPTITFLGIQFDQIVFGTLFSILFFGSLILACLFAIKHNKSNAISQHSKSVLSDLEEEYQEYKRKAIEREQKISRQLQDELNRQKKLNTLKVS
ncbi:MAG: tRNA (guanine-N1)-methyltransferase [Bacteroidota bacterium]